MSARRPSEGARGFFGIGIVNGKTEANLGSLWRAAHLYEASFIFTVGRRYVRQSSDTTKTMLHTPLFEFNTVDDLLAHLPVGCPLVGVELDERAMPLTRFSHPERACYLLGAEDHGLTNDALDRTHMLIQIEAPRAASMNVACAGSIVLAHRYTSRARLSIGEVA